MQATDYYVSASGSNNNNGLSTTTAWQSIAKINSFSFAANDRILFRRGDTFYGGIILKRSNLSFGAYGSGAKPVITGLTTVSSWINSGGNTWEAPVTDVKSGVNLVLRNSTIQQVGRFPNADAANGGYLTYTASTNTSITGPAMSSTTNWTGAEVVIKVNRWSIARQKVTSHINSVVNFTYNPDVPRLNYGYFFQRDSRTLDRDGEWWHNVAGNKLRMYFSSNNPNSFTTQIATVDTLFNSHKYSSISISDLSFNGSGKRSIAIDSGSSITIRNCDVLNSGAEAIVVKASLNVTIDNCTATNSLGAGINVSNPSAGTVNFLIQNCQVLNTSLTAGMETSNERNGGEGINCAGGTGVILLHNSIINSGYGGIRWQGSNVNLKYNLVDRFCLVRDDGAGIYSYESSSSAATTRVNRNIISNIIINGIGNNQGTNVNTTSAQGIYFDSGSKNVIADSNTVAYIANGAFHGNNCASLSIKNNVFFGNLRSISLQRFANADLIRNVTIKKNIMFPYLFRYTNLGINSPAITKESDILSMGTIDSNYYSLGPISDRSLATTTTNADGSDYKEEYFPYLYLADTIGIEKHSKKIVETGTLEYNASSSPRIVSFSGLSKKDVFGNVYNNSVSIPAWSSKVLFPAGGGLLPAVNPSYTVNGLDYKYYEGSWSVLPSFSSLTPVKTGAISYFDISPAQVIVNYGFSFSGYVDVPADGMYTFYTTSDDGSSLYIDDVLVVSNDSLHAATEKSGVIGLMAGKHAISVNFFQQGYGHSLVVSYEGNGISKQVIPSSALYRTNPLLPAVNPANTVNGLDYKYYTGEWLDVPTFSTLTPVKTGVVSNFDISPALDATRFGFSFTGYVSVPADGSYTFYSNSDDGSNLYIDNVKVVSNGGLHGPVEKSGVIGLKAGKHAISVLFFQRGGGASLTVSYSSGGIVKTVIPSPVLSRINPAAPPVSAARSMHDAILGTVVQNNTNTTSELKIISFPNPSSTAFNVIIEGAGNKKIQIQVTDAQGRTVFGTRGSTGETYKFGDNLMPGLYTIRVIQGNKIQTAKVIKISKPL